MELGEKIFNVIIPSKGKIEATVLDIYMNDDPYDNIIYTCYNHEHHILFVCVSRTRIEREDPDDLYSEEVEVTTPPMFSHIISENCTINN